MGGPCDNNVIYPISRKKNNLNWLRNSVHLLYFSFRVVHKIFKVNQNICQKEGLPLVDPKLYTTDHSGIQLFTDQ